MLQKILFSNFLGQNRQGPNFNELMDQPDSLGRLVDDQTFVSEFKSGTQRVREYMTYERFVELTEFVTVVGEQSDKKRGYKYPMIACEMLTSDNSKIDEYFLPQNGVVIVEEKVTKSIEKQVEHEIDDDDEDQVEEDKEENKVKEQNTANQENVEKPKDKAEGEDEQFGQFVAAPPKKKKKIVKMKEAVDVIETIVKEHPPLIEKLLHYFSEPINYTLTAYVCKILVNLLNRKTVQLLTILFEKQEQSDKLFDFFFAHLGSRSMLDLLTRIFTIENSSFIEGRYQVFFRMIEYLAKTDSIDSLGNIVACVGDVLDKLVVHFKTLAPVKELNIYKDKIPDLLKRLLFFVIGTQQLAASYSISVICLLLSQFDLKSEANKLEDWLQKYVEGAVVKLQKYLREERPRLGVVGFKLIESFNYYLKVEGQSSYFSENKQLFPTLFGLLKKYPLNNIFHNQVFKFLTSCLTSSLKELPHNLIENDLLLTWLEQEAKEEQLRRQRNKANHKKGYYGHLFNLCNLLVENKDKNVDIETMTKDERFTFVVSVLVEREASNEDKMLGGWSKNRLFIRLGMIKNILEAHAAFLASAPTSILEKDMQDPMMNPILLEELQQQLDGVEVVNESATTEMVEEEHHKAQLIEQNVHHKEAFWKAHLEYDDGLLQDLL